MGFLSSQLSQRTFLFGLKIWILVCIGVGIAMLLILFVLALWVTRRNRSGGGRPGRKLGTILTKKESYANQNYSPSAASVSTINSCVSKDIRVDSVTPSPNGVLLTITDSSEDKVLIHVGITSHNGGQVSTHSSHSTRSLHQGQYAGAHSFLLDDSHQGNYNDSNDDPQGGNNSSSSLKCSSYRANTSIGDVIVEITEQSRHHRRGSSLTLSEFSNYPDSGHWYTLRELQQATQGFSKESIIGEGGYGIVYKGQLPQGSFIAVKNLFNNMGQAEKEFRVEVEAIGRLRHKNLVRLLGCCIEGAHRMLVYEYVDNGNLEQWLHGSVAAISPLSWQARINITLGTAKALSYLHEDLEPKVVHRDIKASNILVDSRWNAKVSDFGLAKLLGPEKSHVTTRVMGTFGYVAPEYANTGLLNERSDIFSFGVLMVETITGRDPVDYTRAPGEVNLLDWLKVMVAKGNSEEVVDPNIVDKPEPHVIEKHLVLALRCVDPNSERRPKMSQVVRMLEARDHGSNFLHDIRRELDCTKDTQLKHESSGNE